MNVQAVLTFLGALTLVSSHGGGGDHHKARNIREESRNTQHVKEHMDGVADLRDDMSAEETQFHYFKLHDYNNDNRLDGIELVHAVSHFNENEDKHKNLEKPPAMQESEIMALVDEILSEEDHNNDGYIDYTEFVRGLGRVEPDPNHL